MENNQINTSREAVRKYHDEMIEQMWSFTEAMAEVIDARTPYNATHTKNVAKYCRLIIDRINDLHNQGKGERYFNDKRRDNVIMAALLHDIGKVTVPLSIMNKANRLGDNIGEVKHNLEVIELKSKIAFFEQRLDKEAYDILSLNIDRAKKIVDEINTSKKLTIEQAIKVREIIDLSFDDGKEYIPFFTDEQKEMMLIERGTLTEKERKIMESHVLMTERILKKVHFNSYFKNAPIWAVMHHEMLNGKGYPYGLRGDEIPFEGRIIAVADVCDALLATDRPYKKPLPMEEAFTILRSMAQNDEIDGEIVEYLYDVLISSDE